MARYLEVRNSGGNLVIDDESNVIQIMAMSKTLTMNGTYVENDTKETTEKYPCPYQQIVPLDMVTQMLGHKVPVVNRSVETVFAYRVLADMNNPPYVFNTLEYTNNVISGIKMRSHSSAFSMQAVWLSLDNYNVPVPGSALIAYDGNGNISFDSALGYVHHIATRHSYLDVRNSGSFSIQIMNIAGLGIDPSRLFIRMGNIPQIAQYEANGSLYRVGYRSFTPRLRVTNDVIYVDFLIWVPKNYLGSTSLVYNPSYSFSIFYIPSIRDGN